MYTSHAKNLMRVVLGSINKPLVIMLGCSYEFPGAAVINYHSMGGLTQQKFIFPQFWKPEVGNLMSPGSYSFEGSSGESILASFGGVPWLEVHLSNLSFCDQIASLSLHVYSSRLI